MGRAFDHRLFRKADKVVAELVGRGIDQDEAIERVETAILGQVDKSADTIVRDLLATEADFLAQERTIRQGFEERLRADWGEAFDAFYVAAYCVAEAGDRFLDRHEAKVTRRGDSVFQVLAGLHARARRVAFEIHRLLTGGYPLGALARTRTLHELAVTAFIIGEFGRRNEHSDLAQRYIDHDAIARSHYVREYQATAAHSNLPPIPAQEVEAIERRRTALVSTYGRDFKEANGWAATLTQSGRAPKFQQLEDLAQLSHLRSEYQWMCWEVHAGAIGLAVNLVERGQQLVTLPGPTNVGLGNPGIRALASLAQTTCAFFVDGNPNREVDSIDLLSMRALEKLIDRFGPLAGIAEQRILLREQELSRQRSATT